MMRQPSKKQPQKPLLDFSQARGGTREIEQNNRLILPKTCHLLPEVGGNQPSKSTPPAPSRRTSPIASRGSSRR